MLKVQYILQYVTAVQYVLQYVKAVLNVLQYVLELAYNLYLRTYIYILKCTYGEFIFIFSCFIFIVISVVYLQGRYR